MNTTDNTALGTVQVVGSNDPALRDILHNCGPTVIVMTAEDRLSVVHVESPGVDDQAWRDFLQPRVGDRVATRIYRSPAVALHFNRMPDHRGRAQFNPLASMVLAHFDQAALRQAIRVFGTMVVTGVDPESERLQPLDHRSRRATADAVIESERFAQAVLSDLGDRVPSGVQSLPGLQAGVSSEGFR